MPKSTLVQDVVLPELDENFKQEQAYALTLSSGANYSIVSLKAELRCRERQLLSALTQLAELRAASEWVSVEDRLPEYSGVSQIEQYVIAFTNKGIGPYTSVGYFADGKWWEIPFDTDLEHLTVTHWKPIPLPPQLSPASAVKGG